MNSVRDKKLINCYLIFIGFPLPVSIAIRVYRELLLQTSTKVYYKRVLILACVCDFNGKKIGALQRNFTVKDSRMKRT